MSASANHNCGRVTTLGAEMAAYDALPRPLRLALAYLPEDESAQLMLEAWESGERAGVAPEARVRRILRCFDFCPTHVASLMAEGVP